jgi:hypothetical protein
MPLQGTVGGRLGSSRRMVAQRREVSFLDRGPRVPGGRDTCPEVVGIASTTPWPELCSWRPTMMSCSSRRRPPISPRAIAGRSICPRRPIRGLTALAVSLLLAACGPRASAVTPSEDAKPTAAPTKASPAAGAASSTSRRDETGSPALEAASIPSSTAATSEAPPASDAAVRSPIGPVYYANMRNGWVEVLVDVQDTNQLEAMIGAMKGRSELWAGDRGVAPELAAFPKLHLIGSRGVTESVDWAKAGGSFGMTDASWRLLYRPQGNKGPFLAVKDLPPAGTKLRKPSAPRPVKRSHAVATALVRGLAEEKDSNRLPLSAHGVTFTLQVVEGVFPDAAAIAIVTAVDVGATDVPESYSLLLALDGEGRVTRRASPSISDWFYVAYAVGDVDGNGFDDILLDGEGYEDKSVDMVLFGGEGPTWVQLFGG